MQENSTLLDSCAKCFHIVRFCCFCYSFTIDIYLKVHLRNYWIPIEEWNLPFYLTIYIQERCIGFIVVLIISNISGYLKVAP